MSCHAPNATSFQLGRNGDVVFRPSSRAPLRIHPLRREWRITDHKGKEHIISEIEQLLAGTDEETGFLRQRAALMADEMLENALGAGSRTGSHPTSPACRPDSGEQVTFCLLFDGEQLALEVTDPWGRLSCETVRNYLRMNLTESIPSEDRTGRGLYFMWQFMEDFYVSITPGVATSVGGLLQLHPAITNQGADTYGTIIQD
jgi:hypothetical protein